jgi:hypothetical protein
MTSFHERSTELISQAQQFYNPALSYHNWNHAEEVMQASERWAAESDKFRSNTELIDYLRVAAAWHDAGHDHDILEQFESKEAYSVHLMKETIGAQVSEAEFSVLEVAILGTRFNTPRDSDIARLLHYADIDNIGQNYNDFFVHNVLLWEERGKPSWQTWISDTDAVITQLAAEAHDELPLIGVANAFANSMAENSRKLADEPEPTV